MSINFKILGKPGKDNALMVWLNSGEKYYRLLFDCGENLLNSISQSDIKQIDYLFFSHLHIDHVAGFDYFFRRNYDREYKPVNIFGPDYTAEAIHHRLLGYKWNLVNGLPGEWNVSDILENKISSSQFLTKEGFSKKHKLNEIEFINVILENEYFKVEAVILNHIIPSIAYRVTEKDTLNIDKVKLLESGFQSGKWLEKVKNIKSDENETIVLHDKKIKIKTLRKELLKQSKGESIAYLTDFIFDEHSKKRAVKLVSGCDTIVCESQYSEVDKELAAKNYHLITKQTAAIAKKAKVNKLILFHISERYSSKINQKKLLREAREIFPQTYFPDDWKID